MYLELHSQALRSSVPPTHPAVPPLPSPISIFQRPTPQAARMLLALVTSQEWDVEECGRGWDGETDGCCAWCVLTRCDQPRCDTDSISLLTFPALETTPLLDHDTSCSSTTIHPGRRVRSHTKRRLGAARIPDGWARVWTRFALGQANDGEATGAWQAMLAGAR